MLVHPGPFHVIAGLRNSANGNDTSLINTHRFTEDMVMGERSNFCLIDSCRTNVSVNSREW